MTRFAGEVAETFLLWPGRPVAVGSGGEPAGLQEAFKQELAQRFPERHGDDLASVCSDFLKRCPGLWGWYQELCEAQGISISFFDGEPWVDQEGFARWSQLVRKIDADSILTHALVAQGQETAVARLGRWGTLVASADRELARLFHRHGLRDTHLHLSGCDPIAGLWLRLVQGRTRTERLKRYKVSELAALAGGERSLRRAEMERIAQGIEARQRLWQGFLADRTFREQPGEGDLAWYPPMLLDERRLLAWAWSRTLHGDSAVAADLDGYLLAKNRFVSSHHPTPGVHPGLREFRRYFDQGKEWVSEESRRIRRDRLERQILFATECRHLRCLELRIAPFARVDQYVEFFKTWEALLDRRSDLRRLRIVFIVHFIRPTKPDQGQGRLPFEALRRTLDRQTAVLHLFRRTRRVLARHITGIDVANLERDCPPEIFSPFLRLLRADSPELFQSSDPDPLIHQCWLRLLNRGDARHPVDLPRLYLTYHAGEDFYHPLQGMRDMGEIIRGSGMEAGDRIGHGLAAGWDLVGYAQGRGADLQLPSGVLWDALVWAHHRAEQGDLGAFQERRRLEEHALELGESIYGETVPLRIAVRLQQSRHQMISHQNDSSPNPAVRLRSRELFDPECWHARRQLKPFPYEPPLQRLFQAIQKDFVQELTKRRIVIELNPSSNLLISGVPDLRQHPFFRLREIAGPALAVTFNTDDPGVFATRIDAEYALMLDAMMANGIPKHECLETLERVLELAESSAFS